MWLKFNIFKCKKKKLIYMVSYKTLDTAALYPNGDAQRNAEENNPSLFSF